MSTNRLTEPPASPRNLLGPSSRLLLAGQVLYIVVTQFHAGGDANDHHAIFATYAENAIWTAVHLGQFAGMAMLLGGLAALSFALDEEEEATRWLGRAGGAVAVAALALYGALQAVDGVALKQAVNAWAGAPEAEKAARFASAEAIRWLEWGMRSYQDFAMGLALLLFAAALARTAWIARPAGWLMGLCGLAYLAQGWVAGTQGFTLAQSVAIVLSWGLGLAWMIWLAVAARRRGAALSAA
ncbi:conserved membrane hypothetical protein [Mesorhizobium sp. ORS 3324]|nr:conserved membrane hypothetical protein [Mesorhizobium sp. ORS 3324]